MLKLTITRPWAPVTREVTKCQECPWFVREREQGVGTLPVCQHPKYNGGKGGYDAVLGDETLISDLCPEIKHMNNPTEKYELMLLCLKDGVSKLKAIKTLSELSKMSIAQTQYVLEHFPQFMCSGGSETFKSWVMTKEELYSVMTTLNPYFEMQARSASSDVLPYGCCVFPPWHKGTPSPAKA